MQAQRAATGVKSATSNAKSDSSHVSIVQAVWQHPYVDVFKHFKIMPLADWKANKRQGDVQEAFAREIGFAHSRRRVAGPKRDRLFGCG